MCLLERERERLIDRLIDWFWSKDGVKITVYCYYLLFIPLSYLFLFYFSHTSCSFLSARDYIQRHSCASPPILSTDPTSSLITKIIACRLLQRKVLLPLSSLLLPLVRPSQKLKPLLQNFYWCLTHFSILYLITITSFAFWQKFSDAFHKHLILFLSLSILPVNFVLHHWQDFDSIRFYNPHGPHKGAAWI